MKSKISVLSIFLLFISCQHNPYHIYKVDCSDAMSINNLNYCITYWIESRNATKSQNLPKFQDSTKFHKFYVLESDLPIVNPTIKNPKHPGFYLKRRKVNGVTIIESIKPNKSN